MNNIVFFCHDFYPNSNGYANAFYNLVNAILDHSDDIHVTVITPVNLCEHNEIFKEKLTVIRIKNKYTAKIKFFGKFIDEYKTAAYINKYIKNNNAHILFVETFDQPFFLSFIDRDLYTKTIVRIHSTSETEYTFYIPSLIYKIKRFLLQKYVVPKLKWIASTNSFHIKFAKEKYYNGNLINIGKANFFIIPNTIYPEPVSFENSSVKNRKKIKAVCLGRMEYEGFIQKGFEDLFIALNIMSHEELLKLDLTVIGSGIYKEKLLKLGNNIDCISYIDKMSHDEIIKLLSESDLVILPSRFEGLSMFALEGLAYSNICLFSRTGGLVDLITENGLFTEVQDIYSIVNGLRKILLMNHEEIDRMKLNSSEKYYNEFSNKSVYESFQKAINVINKYNSEI